MEIAKRTEPSLDDRLAKPTYWGKVARFTVQELKKDMFDECLDLVEAVNWKMACDCQRYLIPEEAMCVALDMKSDAKSRATMLASARDCIRDGTSIVVFKGEDYKEDEEKEGREVVCSEDAEMKVDGDYDVAVDQANRVVDSALHKIIDTFSNDESEGKTGESEYENGSQSNSEVTKKDNEDSADEVELERERTDKITLEEADKEVGDKMKGPAEKQFQGGKEVVEDNNGGKGEEQGPDETLEETRRKRERKKRRHKRKWTRVGKESILAEEEGEGEGEDKDDMAEEDKEEEEGEQRVVAVLVARVVQRLEHMRSFSRVKIVDGEAYRKWLALRCHLERTANLFEEFGIDSYYKVYHIVVHPDHRRKGVASFLVRLAAQRLVGLFAGPRSVCVAVTPCRSSQRLLARQGFRPRVVLNYHEWKDEQGQQIIKDAGVGNYNVALVEYQVPTRPPGETIDVSPLEDNAVQDEDSEKTLLPTTFPGRKQGLLRPPSPECPPAYEEPPFVAAVAATASRPLVAPSETLASTGTMFSSSQGEDRATVDTAAAVIACVVAVVLAVPSMSITRTAQYPLNYTL